MFDAKLSEKKRNAALRQLGNSTPPEDMRRAFAAVEACARAEAEFTTDDVWRLLEAGGPLIGHENRFLGKVMSEAAIRGWCVKNGKQVRTGRVEAHRREIPVWKSLLTGVHHARKAG